MNSKTPGLDYLYPDKKYSDRVAVNYMPQGNPDAQILAYHTQVYDVQKSKNLKNATTTKVELGIDFKLPGNRKLSLLAYHDKTPNGFGPATEYFVYKSDYYNNVTGINFVNGQITGVAPTRTDYVFMTTGAIGNTNTTVNKGIEFDFDLGSIKPLHTKFLFSGAYSETKTWSTDMNSANAKTVYVTQDYNQFNTTPFKVVYPSALDYNKYRQFINTLHIVTNIPRLRMVASFTAQTIWYNYNYDFTASKNAIGYITPDLAYHEISENMQNGFLDMKGNYYAEKPADIHTAKISDLGINGSNSVPTKSPITWNIQGRLTKELGKIGGLSLYVNNVSYYEPYLKINTSNSLVQRNTNKFSYGVELNFKL